MGEMVKMKLPESFIEQYKGRQPKWGFNGLGFVVWLRTYARKKPDGTLEEYYECVRRVTEGNFSIEATRLKQLGKLTEEKKAELMEEMKRFYHLMFNLAITPPGRGWWMSGTEYAERVGDAENNCWFVSMRPQKYGKSKIQPVLGSPDDLLPSMPAVFTFDQAMKGGGVGVNVQRKNVDQMPVVKKEVKLSFACDPDHNDYQNELVSLGVRPTKEFENNTGKVFYHTVKDSREGWAETLSLIIDAHFIGDHDTIVVDISQVRPRGSEIKGFGGIASGPAPLVQMLERVNNILNKRVGQKVHPVEWGDIIQNIGCCVVAGNVRRTALILIGDPEDKEFVESKNYSLPENMEASQWRWASNNSIDLNENVDHPTYVNIAKNIYYNGEPGVVDTETSRNYGRIIDGFQALVDALVEGFNPCGEITLPNGSPCNLFEINLPKLHELVSAGIEDESIYTEAAWLATRYAYRITFREYDWEVTRNIVEKHRRLGVGITGFTDWVLLKFGRKAILGFDKDGTPIFNQDVCNFLDKLYKDVKETNRLHAQELEANPSIKLTTVKPSGTLSILMGVSAGMHFHWSRYMIRRVRIAANAPLVPILFECGYKIEPAYMGTDKDGNPQYDYNTYVVEFPIKAPTADHPDFQSAGDVPLREQAAIQALLQTYWSDNAVSATLTFHKAENKEDEQKVIEEIASVLEQFKGKLKSTSMLPHASGTYPQMPLEAITKEQYEKMVSRLKAKPWELIEGTIMAEEEEAEVVGECAGGHCPIK